MHPLWSFDMKTRLLSALIAATFVGACAVARPPTATPGRSSIAVASAPPSPSFEVSVAPGLDTKLSPDAAAATALKDIANMERVLGRQLSVPAILSVDALKGSDVPIAFGHPELSTHPVVWLVKARGTFVSFFGGPLNAERPQATDGYFLLDDEGSVIGTVSRSPSRSSDIPTRFLRWVASNLGCTMRRVDRFMGRSACCAAIVFLASACVRSTAPAVTVGPVMLGISNGTSMTVGLFLNGAAEGTYGPQSGIQISAATLSALPWDLEARTTSGRVLTSMHVTSDELQSTVQAGVTTYSGALARVDLSCGSLRVWAGGSAPSGPVPDPSAGQPGDCRP
jgi:hypothetical protein